MATQPDKIVVISGAFDCISQNDIRYLKQCTLISDWLIAGVHSDRYLEKIEDFPVQNYETRRGIISELVDEVLTFDDMDGSSIQLLKVVKLCYPGAQITYITNKDLINSPELKVKGIKFIMLKQE